ncbi:SLC25A29 (predicted) [Pycnogonum litorale]
MALDFIAGCFGGIAGVAVGHPFDTVKVRLQTQDARNPKYTGMIHCFKQIIHQESVRGLYKGISSPMAGLAFINAIVFGVYGNTIKQFSDSDSISTHFIAGSTAGLLQSFACSPMELAKTRMQIQGQGDKIQRGSPSSKAIVNGPVDCLRRLYKTDGLRGPFRGLSITLCREIPSLGMYFAVYEGLCKKLLDDREHTNPFVILLSGSAAGMVSWVATYPIDVVKSRFQADSDNRYKSIRDCCVKSYREEGWRVFTRGLNSTIARSIPTNAVTFFVVTYTLKFLSFEVQDIPDSEIDLMFEKTGATLLW